MRPVVERASLPPVIMRNVVAPNTLTFLSLRFGLIRLNVVVLNSLLYNIVHLI